MIRASLRSLSPRDRRALLLGSAIVGPVLIYMLLVKPYVAAVSDLQREAEAQRALLARELDILARGNSFPRDIERAEQLLSRAQARLVKSADEPIAESELTRYFEDLARSARVLLQEMRATAPGRTVAPPEGTRVVRLSISGESDLNGIAKFVQGIETGPLLLDIAEFSIEPKPQERARTRDNSFGGLQQRGVLQFRMTVQAFAPAPTQETVR